MVPCECRDTHQRRRIVLTGGPGAGKTAILELIRQSFCSHVKVLPESASILFGGGFLRSDAPAAKRAAQRAIYHVQHELEEAADADGTPAIVLCDRGTVDGIAYWPGPQDLWSAVGTTQQAELARYDAVIHLRTPGPTSGYDHSNPLRVESAPEALALDQSIAAAWERHPHRFIIESAADFLEKARQALQVLRGELPQCCRRHVVPSIDEQRPVSST